MQKIQPSNFPTVELRASGIHGKGLFSLQTIKKGEKIIQYKGEKISGEEGTRRSEQHDFLTYIFTLNDKFDIDGAVNGNESRFANHSCIPNSEIDIFGEEIWIIADKDIEKGEEITYDYALDADEILECKCGAKDCRGYINDPDDDCTKKLLNGKNINK